jgi:hypothetical protein
VTVAHVVKIRALDCEWGGWRAIIGAAAFFAVYQPTLSWAPVAVLGALKAMLDKAKRPSRDRRSSSAHGV